MTEDAAMSSQRLQEVHWAEEEAVALRRQLQDFQKAAAVDRVCHSCVGTIPSIPGDNP